ncbi:MAG: VCBS repeat-containing protein [Phycisphaerales bacterium]|nr:MAG: VCBS repeat-containing protein [Phycisphaerales bacterium]
MKEVSATAPGLASLPSGDGGIAPLGDRFQPDLVRGTGSYSVPIRCPKGVNEQQPSLNLTYSTASGNGPFGLGWRMGGLTIERRTDRGLPTYTTEDTFVLGGAEVLVRVDGNRYRPKTDTKFWKIERTGDHWEVRTGDGNRMLFGDTAGAREEGPEGIFAWHLSKELDAAGNEIEYSYTRDGGRLYLSEVRYGIFRVAIQYEARPDILADCRAGFERRTALRARSIEIHCSRLAPTLMRSYELAYEQAANAASLLQRIRLEATKDGETARYPDLIFTYASPAFDDWRVHEIQSRLAPPSLDDDSAQLVAFTGSALPDVLQSSGSRMFLWRNRGDGWLEGPTVVDGVPSTVSLSRDNVGMADLNADGRVDLFAVDQPLQVAFESTGRGSFRPDPVVFRSRPSLRLSAGDTRLIDIDGDGVTDLMATLRTHFLLYRHEVGVGWQEPIAAARVADLETFPDLTFGGRGVRLADMNGDGLQDFLLVESGRVRYWPYHGNGRWGTSVEMAGAPTLPCAYRDERLHAIDVDGDGCTDLVYRDWDRTLIWINQSGTGFSAPIEIPVPVGIGDARVIPCDFFGDGRVGFAWSSTATTPDSTGYRYLRFDQGRKPYLMTAIDNGMGGEHLIEYATSTLMRREDADAGEPWLGEVPFVANVVRSITQRDPVTSREQRLDIRYHDGVYDGSQREFRGFRRVTVENSGDESVPATVQEYEFFQGDPDLIDPAERDRERALAGAVLRTRTFETRADGRVLRNESSQTWTTREEFSAGTSHVHFPFVTKIEMREISDTGAPARIERTLFDDHDIHGNVRRRRRESLAEGDPPSQWIRSEERYTFSTNEAGWLIHLPVRSEMRDQAGLPFGVKTNYYDGPPMVGLPEGQAAKGLLTRVEELRMLEARLPPGYLTGRDLTTLGYRRTGAGDTVGYYADTMSVRRAANGNVVEQRDASGVAVTIEYDADGVFPVRSFDTGGREATIVFEPRAGQPSQVVMADGRRVDYHFDPLGRLISTTEADDAGAMQLVKCWFLDVENVPTSVTSIVPNAGGPSRADFEGVDLTAMPNVSISRVYYDGLGSELLQVTTAPRQGGSPRFLAHHRSLNTRGLVKIHHTPHLVATLDFAPAPAPDAASVRTRYDSAGRVEETIGPGPSHMLTLRDTFHLDQFEGNAAGPFGTNTPGGAASRREHFDARGRLIRIEEADGAGGTVTTSYELALDGRILSVRGSGGETTAAYDLAGPAEPVRITGLDAGTRTYYRDAGGRLRERVDADSSRLVHAYDALGRLTRIEHKTSGGALSTVRELIYDVDPTQPSVGRFLNGRLAVAREGAAEVHYSYNRAGKTVREETTAAGRTLAVEREYDLQGRPTAIVYPDARRVEYTLDNSGAVLAIPGVVSDVTYSANQNVIGYRLANGVDVQLPRSSTSFRLERITARHGALLLRELAYTYDDIGNVAMIRDEIPGEVEHHAFDYDGLHRLTGFRIRRDYAMGQLLKQGAYTYDGAGNMRSIEEASPLQLAYGDAVHPNRLTSIQDGAVATPTTYNARGAIESMGELQQIEYDPFDRVTRIRKADGTELRFAYDPKSRRILKETTAGGVTTRVHYAAGLYEERGNQAFRYVYLGKSLVATESVDLASSAVVVAFHACDHHATVLLSTDGTGAIVDNQRYTAFGAPRTTAALDRYLGRPRDVETGLLHLGARFYAPSIGRFISPDWWVLENPTKALRIPQGYNPYSYAINNPLVFRDPSGLWFGIDDLIVAAVGFVVGFVSGLIYGLVNGQGWDSLLTALETGLTTAAGAWLGWTVGGPLGMLMGGMNGLMSGIHGIYDWESAEGWFAFLSDSTWNLIGTTLGNVVHIINAFNDSTYREDLSQRQNRHVYEGGFGLKDGFAFTQGNVISNVDSGHSVDFLRRHEELHIWQGRIFGPIFQATYIGWAVGGFIVGTIVWFWHTDEDYGDFIESAAYYDNPFELWAYANDRNWPPGDRPAGIYWDACYRDDGTC